ncbi:hypothetical protein AB0K60_03870 [Thermopolyspora sp. NPDC052614]|uniref:hypothetical protein n=1 Tax=Thermopolyspora sp. NPDC052614 TaxID=3155682 RepID=UPI0034239B3E
MALRRSPKDLQTDLPDWMIWRSPAGRFSALTAIRISEQFPASVRFLGSRVIGHPPLVAHLSTATMFVGMTFLAAFVLRRRR